MMGFGGVGGVGGVGGGRLLPEMKLLEMDDSGIRHGTSRDLESSLLRHELDIHFGGNVVCPHHRPRSSMPPGQMSRVTSPILRRIEFLHHGSLALATAGGPRRSYSTPSSAAAAEKPVEEGAMSRRLDQMTEGSLSNSPRRAVRTAPEADFSQELKAQLEGRVGDAGFVAGDRSAMVEASLPDSVGAGSRAIATAQSWTGEEMPEDAVLRMLTDKHRPLKNGRPGLIPQPKLSGSRTRKPGQRLATAKDGSTSYKIAKDSQLTSGERTSYRRAMKERFERDARSIPATIQGLTNLANERIEDAIARGQFKDIPRGKPLERDYNASNPFLDTTEYFMNKMIQRQNIVPPWIDKQMELGKMVSSFRSRLREDWLRHVARSIASRGGSVLEQVEEARRYARIEERVNPRRKARKAGKVDGLTASEASTNQDDGAETEAVEKETPETSAPASSPGTATVPNPDALVEQEASGDPFRDPTWLASESSYLTLSIKSLNDLTRSYNLMCPELAKKPYFALDRELLACSSDVAPGVADEIVARATRPKGKIGGEGGGGERRQRTAVRILDGFDVSRARVYDEEGPGYGFGDFWRDLWARGR